MATGPGDFLLIDPQEPHSISSRCKAEDEIFCASSYLKTAIVGLNDNSNTVVKELISQSGFSESATLTKYINLNSSTHIWKKNILLKTCLSYYCPTLEVKVFHA